MRKSHLDRGATLVEFAILAPLLITLLLGIVEFGWLFSQNVDVRHGAREAARLAATDYGDENAIALEACDRMDIAGTASVSIDLQHPDGTGIGGRAVVTVSAVPDSLTGFFDAILPGTLDSTVETRLEQTATWANTATPIDCP